MSPLLSGPPLIHSGGSLARSISSVARDARIPIAPFLAAHDWEDHYAYESAG